jgi:GntR family transcriptional regulator
MAGKAEDAAAQIRAQIQSGELAPGTKLPTTSELAATHGFDVNTARRVMATLRAEGLVEYRPGRGGKGGGGGTYVRERPTTRMVRSRAVERDPMGYYSGKAVQHWRLVEGTRTEVDTAPVPADVAELLGVPAGTPTIVRRRLNGDPAVAEHRQLTDSWIHPDAVEALPVLAGDTGLGGMYDRVEEWAERPISWSETITAAMPSPAEAAALLLPAGVPVLRVLRTSTIRTPDGQTLVFEVNDIRMSAELFAVSYPLSRAKSARWPVTRASRDFYSG